MKEAIKIIMIDDNKSSNLYHSIMMEQANIDSSLIKEFTSVDAGLEFLKECNQSSIALPKIILLDINMPKYTGWQFLDLLTELELPEYEPTIYLVSNSRYPKDMERAKDHPMVTDLLEKHLEEDFFSDLKKSFDL